MSLQENKQRLVTAAAAVSNEWLQEQITFCVERIRHTMQRYKDDFPSACTTGGRYRIKGNDDWTNGFWTGMLWLAYEATNDDIFYQQALRNCQSFQERLDQHYILDHHDIGFLYSLSAGAGYQITHEENYKKQVIQAADKLVARYHSKGSFIQAWGSYGEKKEYRLIIDSLINLPLLFRASQLSDNPVYREIAEKHYDTVLNTVIKEDGTTYHTYYFDPDTGGKLYGATHQGHSDESIWARGQSWAVLGIPLDQSYLPERPYPSIYPQIVDVFLTHLPQDLIPYWDFDFDDQQPSAKDSSAAAITACGLLEAAKVQAYPEAAALARGFIYQLGEQYTARDETKEEGLLLHGVYAYSEGKGIDESNLWGDYFYFESLMRIANPEWNRYW